jgi:pilus assembly protein FimV
MRKHLQISGLLSALLLASGVEAAGLGKLSVQSALGQPLRAEIELVAVQRDELGSINARLASAEAFRQARMERAEALNSLRFEVDQRPNGQPVIKITSAAPVNDPFLDLLIELNWSTGRLIREYTLLLDPPADVRPRAETPPPQAAVSTRTEREPVSRPAAAGEPPAARPAEGLRYGPVKAGETLHAIASKTKPADVTLDQMMLGIYQQNNAAFQGNNMNRLKRGAVLKLPDRDAAMRVDPARASREVRLHADAWNAYRARLADAAAARAAGAAPEAAAGRVMPAPERREAPPAAAAEDVLRLSKGEPGAARAMEKIQSLEEELAAKGRALLEAQERVAQLERTVKDMQRLLELKSAEPPVAAPPAAPAAPVTPPPAPEAVAPTPAPKAAAPAPAPKPAQPALAATPLPTPEPGPSWLSTFISNPLYIGGIVAAVLLSFLLWMMMVGTRRRKGLTNFEDSIMTGGEFKNEAVFTAGTGVAGTPTGGSALMTDFSRLGLGAIDAHEVDPIAEAEVYMAYGRDTQAEEILKEALAKDPNRHEIALKLLEIYAARKDTVAFETQASELYASLGGQPTEVWLKAAEMGRGIDPDNPLYRVTPSVTGPAMVAAGTAAATAAAAMAAANAPAEAAPGEALTDLGLLSGASETPPEITPEVEALMEQDVATAMAEAPAPVEAFDLGGLGEPPAGPEVKSSDLGMLEMELPGHDKDVETERLAVVEGPEAAEYDLSLDVTEIEEPLPPPAAPEVTVAEAASGMADLEMPSEEPAAQPVAMAEAPYAPPEIDLSGIDLELGEPHTETPS